MNNARQELREALAREVYLKYQLRQLNEQLHTQKEAFKGGWVARDSLLNTDHISYENIDEHGDVWYAAWERDEETK